MATSIAASGKSVWGFSPQSIPGLALWLDGADSSSFTFSSGSNISSWRDKSGKGLNVSTTANYPVYTSTGVQFTGSTPTVLSNVTGYAASNTLTTFVVYQSTVASSRQRYFVSTYNGNYNIFAGDTTYITAGTTSLNNYQGPISYSANTTYLISQVGYSAGSISWAINGTESLSWGNVGAGSASGSTSILVGGQSTVYFTGYIMEILMYDSYFTSSQRQQVEGYLAAKWGLKANLPATHPYSATASVPFNRTFRPVDIPGCSLWLDAADSTSMTLSGISVTSWNDKSGNGYNASGGVSPTYSSNVIQFNGSSYLSTSIPAGSNSASYFFVFSPSTTGSTVPLGGNALSTAVFIQGSTSIALGDWNTNVATFSTALNAGTTYIASGMASGGVLSVGINGATMATGSATFSGTGTFTVGAGYTDNRYKFLGSIGEIILFNTALSTPQRQQVEQYLTWKWGLPTANLPTGHPGKLLPAFGTPFTPKSLTGMALWLDAADPSTITGTSTVTAWADKSGNGNSVTSTAGFGTMTLSNNPVNGKTSIFSSGQNCLQVPSFTITAGQALTAFHLVVPTLAGGDIVGLHLGPNQGGTGTYFGDMGYQNTNGNTSFLYIPTTNGGMDNAYAYTPALTYQNTFVILTATYNGGTTLLGYYNGNKQGPSTLTSSLNLVGQPLRIGSRNSSENTYGHICESILYFGLLTTPQIQQVEGYLAWKWGLQSSLPSTHAYAKFSP
jgi:hypothetical protein